jgi:23S rRNA (guanine745-N1)-methyltransferase
MLVCPVRGCGQPLAWGEREATCPRRHRFDVARSGYLNLLQPQDRKSTEAGDSKEAVAARRRSMERGLGEALLAGLIEAAAGWKPAATLDLGCGEGFFLGSLCARLGLEGWGLDLSVPAVDLAARSWKGPRWIVANADRTLPFADGSFALVLSITGRKPAAEMARVLAPGGRVIVAVSAEDDLAELRAVLYGQATEKDRSAATVEAFADRFVLERTSEARAVRELDRAAIDDILASTYRGARRSQQERLAGVEKLPVTLAQKILVFRAR